MNQTVFAENMKKFRQAKKVHARAGCRKALRQFANRFALGVWLNAPRCVDAPRNCHSLWRPCR